MEFTAELADLITRRTLVSIIIGLNNVFVQSYFLSNF